MSEPRNAFVQGAICGAMLTAGGGFLLFWRLVMTSPNAGAIVDGRFQPYQTDPSWHAIAVGDALVLMAALVFLLWTWRRLPR